MFNSRFFSLTALTLAAPLFLPAARAHTTATAPQITTDPATLPSPPPPTQTLTLYFENDGSFVHPGGTDKHYTSGVGFSFAGQWAWTREFGRYIPTFENEFNPARAGTSFAAGFEAVQDIYTPADLSRPDVITDDRPYAGWLYAGLFWQRAWEPTAADDHGFAFGHFATMEHFQLDIGTTGPSSLAGTTQKFWHTHVATDAVPPQGWGNQIHDEVGFDFTYLRKWRFTLAPAVDWKPAVQIIPEAGFTAGTIQRYATAGAVARAGWGFLPDDFGPGRLHEVSAFTGLEPVTSPVGLYFFGRANGNIVQHNTFLEGNNFRDSNGIDEHPFVGEFQAGGALQFFRHFELIYSQTLRTPEFKGQQGPDVYGALSLAMSWNF